MEPNTLEWMTEQRDRLRAETDLANTRYDKLVAQDKVEQAKLREQIEQLRQDQASQLAALETAHQQRNEQSAAIIAGLTGKVAEARKLAEQRRLALADVMKLVGAVLEKVMPLIQE